MQIIAVLCYYPAQTHPHIPALRAHHTEDKEVRIVFFLGPNGCGKGTQANLLARNVRERSSHRLHTFTTSELLIHDPACKAIMDRGDLCNDDVVCSALDRAIAPLDCDTLIIDGFPRSLGQAKHVLKIAHTNDVQVVRFMISDEVAVARCVERNRGSDDDRETAERRLRVYRATSTPGVRLLEESLPDLCHAVDGEPPASEVLATVRSILGL